LKKFFFAQVDALCIASLKINGRLRVPDGPSTL